MSDEARKFIYQADDHVVIRGPDGKVIGGEKKAAERVAAAMFKVSLRRVLAAILEDEGWVGNHWGRAGAGVLFTTGTQILLLKRSSWVDQPGTWGIPGGAIPVDEQGKPDDTFRSALREVREEAGVVPVHHVIDRYVYRDGAFTFTTFIATVDEPFTPHLNGESTSYVWADREHLPSPLHHGVVAMLRTVDPFTSDRAVGRGS